MHSIPERRKQKSYMTWIVTSGFQQRRPKNTVSLIKWFRPLRFPLENTRLLAVLTSGYKRAHLSEHQNGGNFPMLRMLLIAGQKRRPAKMLLKVDSAINFATP